MRQMSFLKRLFGLQKKPAPAPEPTPELSPEGIAIVEAAALDAFEITETEIPGFSQVGGNPLLPAGFSWPMAKDRAFSFLAQIDLSELGADRLPEEGYLYFFFNFGKPDVARVFLLEGDADEFQELSPPKGKAAAPFIEFKPSYIEFETEINYPSNGSEYPKLDLSDEDAEAYDGYIGDLHSQSHLLGYAYEVQNPMEDDCHQAFPGISKSPDDWTLLLQLGEVEESEIIWGDGGRAYFWIRKEDLANLNFDRVYFTTQYT